MYKLYLMDILVRTVNGRPDKNDLILQDLVKSKAWKQALAHCDKRLKKGEKNDYLSVSSKSWSNIGELRHIANSSACLLGQ